MIGDNGYITYDFTSGLPIPTFHCKCGEKTEGFRICLKCNPQKYEVTALVGTPPNLPWWRLRSMSDDDIQKFNRSHMVEVRMVEQTEKILNEHEHKLYQQTYKKAWNAAIDKLADIIDNNKGVLFTADEIRKFKNE